MEEWAPLESEETPLLLAGYLRGELLLSLGRLRECVVSVRGHLLQLGKCPELGYDSDAVARQELRGYLLLLRCFELLGEGEELLGTAGQCSRMFVEGGHWRGSLSEVVDVMRWVWAAVVFSAARPAPPTYNRYFTPQHPQTHLISLPTLYQIIATTREASQGEYLFEQKEAVHLLVPDIPAQPQEPSAVLQCLVECLTRISRAQLNSQEKDVSQIADQDL